LKESLQKKKQEDTTQPDPLPAKPVVRSDALVEEEAANYFPLGESESSTQKGKANAEALKTEPIPAGVVSEDQVHLLQRIFAAQADLETEAGTSAIQDEMEEVLVFQLGNENYGIDIYQIIEIIRFVEPTLVPNTVGFLDGIISLRGKVIPVVNGRKRLGHPPRTPDQRTRIIVLNDGKEIFGILVDSVSEVTPLSKKSIEAASPVVMDVNAEFIQGVCEQNNNLIILLNLEGFLKFS